ncbi:MAG: exo-alpha-sialidase [Verrucomicrobia bacterium]|nr:exo-alpha-sialidase [Verrucomicrobiota bacterium]
MNLEKFITGLSGPCRFQRNSSSWSSDFVRVAGPNVPHIENTKAGPALFLGRQTRNLLPREFAPFQGVPEDWARIDGLEFQKGRGLLIRASHRPAILPLPLLHRDSLGELSDEGTTFVGVIYQLSAHVRGHGKVSLRLRDGLNSLEVQRGFMVVDRRQRWCVALDGPMAKRSLEAAVIVEEGEMFVDGLMLEPFVTTYRTARRSVLFPCPGSWVPGGEARDRDRLEVRVPRGSIPKSGMIDFWFQPAWEAAHPNHIFFDMAHGYFSFGAENQEPLLHAGEKPCPWMYYWEWCLGQGFRSHSWHHAAAVWDEDGAATIYWNGQSHACVQQVKAHALDPLRVGETMVVGGCALGGMLADPNVAAELDGWLRSWRLTPGRFTAEDVLLAMESTCPLPGQYEPPANVVFLEPGPRHEIISAPSYCWFPNVLSKESGKLIVKYVCRPDHLPGVNERARPSRHQAESDDDGRTWKNHRPVEPGHGRPAVKLPDGRWCSFPHVTNALPDGRIMPREQACPDSFTLRLTATDQHEELVQARVDMAGYNGGRMPLALDQLLALKDGGYLLFADGILPGDERSSMLVLASDDLRRWRAVAVPMRDDGLREEGYCEAAAVQLANGRILMVARTGGFNQALMKSVSDDNGRTWSPPERTGLCGVAPQLRTLRDGTLFLTIGRPGIILAVSCDNGESFETQVCVEDDRIHEMAAHFGWYGYSSMNNGLLVDECAGQAYLTYDLLGVRSSDNGASRNGCYLRGYSYRTIKGYARRIRSFLSVDHPSLQRNGRWQEANDRLAVTTQTGAAICGEFQGDGLVALIETSPHAGTAIVRIDEQPPQRLRLYYPRRIMQRRLLAAGLPDSRHCFQIGLESGFDPEHKFANPEMPMLGGPQTCFLAGVTATRRLAVYGFEVL